MTDRIQVALARHHDQQASSRQVDEALRQLSREWRPQLVARLRQPSPEEVEDLLQGALVELALSARRPRALAPQHVANAKAWRRRVLSNWLVDRLRARGRRLHAVQAMAAGWSPTVEKEQWRARRRRDGRWLTREVARGPQGASMGEESLLDGLDERRQLQRLLPGLSIRRRVLVVMAAGADPSPYARELSEGIGDTVDAVLWRMRSALSTRHDGRHDLLSTAMVRVVYPQPRELHAAREAARKALERAIIDLRRRVASTCGDQAA